MIEITNKAKEEILKLMEKNPGTSLRLFMEGFGWGGPRYGLSLDETKEEDEVRVVNGINVALGPEEQGYLTPTKIDFRKSFWGKGLTVEPIHGGAC